MDVRELKDRATRLCAARRFAESEKVYEQLIAHQRSDPELLLRHAHVAELCGHPVSAARSYQRAGALWKATGHKARAQAAYRRSLALNPEDRSPDRALAELSALPEPSALERVTATSTLSSSRAIELDLDHSGRLPAAPRARPHVICLPAEGETSHAELGVPGSAGRDLIDESEFLHLYVNDRPSQLR